MLYALIGVLLGAAGPAASGPQAAASQPNLTAVKADFIPGDKTIFYDDFSDMEGDEPPPHWKVRGGAFELMTGSSPSSWAGGSRTDACART